MGYDYARGAREHRGSGAARGMSDARGSRPRAARPSTPSRSSVSSPTICAKGRSTGTRSRSRFRRRTSNYLRRFATNLTDDKILARVVESPLDLERMNPHNWHGSCHGGAQNAAQSANLRPVPGWASHRMPIAGLYQTGSTTHPGGSISAGPGRNAAAVLLKDFGSSLEKRGRREARRCAREVPSARGAGLRAGAGHAAAAPEGARLAHQGCAALVRCEYGAALILRNSRSCAPWCWSAAHAAHSARAGRSRSRRGRDPHRDQRLRRLPHRPACRRRRIAGPEAADRCRATRSSGGWRRSGTASPASRSASASACRGSAQTCGVCPYCRAGRENLCDRPVLHRLYARRRLCHARGRRCALLLSASRRLRRRRALAPLLCAGLIGWRSYEWRMAGRSGTLRALGLYGFGAAAHILAQVAAWQGRRVYAFTRRGDAAGAGLCPHARRRLGRRLRRDAARAARRRDHFRAGRRARSGGAQGRAQGRTRGLRRHPHVGHPELSLSAALGGAPDRLGRQPDA